MSNSIAYDGCGALQIISGIILVQSVLAVRDFLKKRGAEDFINTAMLMRHAYAFGLYLFTTCLFYMGWTIYAFDPKGAYTFLIFNLAAIINFIGSLASETLLCFIFWDLGKKIEKPKTFEEDYMDDMEIVSEDFDDDAEMQANIWNSMVR